MKINSGLKELIIENSEIFYIHIENIEGKSFIEITDKKTSRYYNINVCIGDEYNGLLMVLAEWDYLDTALVVSETVH